MTRLIRRRDFFKAFLRSFYIQGSYNYEGMINLGMVYTMLPVFRRLSSDPQYIQNLLHRHMGFFNTNPILASYALGAVVRLEQMRLEKHQYSPKSIERLKTHISRSLAAIGDRLFWSALRPLSAIVGISVIMLFAPWQPYNIYGGLAVFLLLFNIPRFYFQYVGFIRGYRHGADIIKHMPLQTIERMVHWILYGGLICIGGYLFLAAEAASQIDLFTVLLFLFGTTCAFWLSYRNRLNWFMWILLISTASVMSLAFHMGQ